MRRSDITGNLPLVLDTHMFMKIHSLLKQEMTNLHIAFSRSRKYSAPASHTPFALFYDHDFTLGTTTQPLHPVWLLSYSSEFEPGIKSCRIKSLQADNPSSDIVGEIKYSWRVTASPRTSGTESEGKESASEIAESHMTTEEMIGSEWKVELDIFGISGLKVEIASLYCR